MFCSVTSYGELGIPKKIIKLMSETSLNFSQNSDSCSVLGNITFYIESLLFSDKETFFKQRRSFLRSYPRNSAMSYNLTYCNLANMYLFPCNEHNIFCKICCGICQIFHLI